MKKIAYLFVCMMLLTACEDFLDTENYTKKDTSNFPETLEDAEQLMAGIYNSLNMGMLAPEASYFYYAELVSDDRLGGGGENDKHMQSFDKMLNYTYDQMLPFWERRYQGIFRANMALETLDKCTGYNSEAQKNQMMGEAHFLRAFFYHELAEAFENIPLVLATEPVNLPQAEPAVLYGQIAYDLKSAIEKMYSTPYTSLESGHATKWAAQALMARVFLFYTGFYNSETLPLGDGEGENVGTVTRAQVIEWLEDCISNSGHRLISDYRELWPYTNRYTAPDYPYANGLDWVGDGNMNPEVMFAIKCSSMASWTQVDNIHTMHLANGYVLHFGLRAGNGFANTFPFGQGWGAGPVNTTLWNEWRQAEPDDIRRTASILDVEAECEDYLWGQDAQMEETGYWQKKIIVTTAYENKEAGDLYFSFSIPMWGGDNNFQSSHYQDLNLIRYADVLLMHSELKQDAASLNQVRTRAGLEPVPYSLDAIKKERRWELSFEGRRWADIRRWGDAADLLSRQTGVTIRNSGIETTMRDFNGGYRARYEATRGFFKIPESQILLSDGQLVQNPGWTGPDSDYQGW